MSVCETCINLYYACATQLMRAVWLLEPVDMSAEMKSKWFCGEHLLLR